MASAAIAFCLLHWRADIARMRVDRDWALVGKPLPATSATLDGTYLPAGPGSEHGGPMGMAIRGNKVIFEESSDVLVEDEMPGEYALEIVEHVGSREQASDFASKPALLLRNSNGITQLVHARASRHFQFLVMHSKLVPYTLGSLVDGEDGVKGCLGVGDLIKVSYTPSNEFAKFRLPAGYACHAQIGTPDDRPSSPQKSLVLDILMELYSPRQ